MIVGLSNRLIICISLLVVVMVSCIEQQKLSVYEDQLVYAFELDKQMPLVSEEYPNLSEEEAYRIQKGYVNKLLAHENIGGYKASFIDTKVHNMDKVGNPIFSVIFESDIQPHNSELSLYGIHKPVLETYLGFTFNQSIQNKVNDIDELKSLIDSYRLIGDITDLKFHNLNKTKTVDFIATNAVSSFILVGDTTKYTGQDFHNSLVQINYNNNQLYELRPKRDTQKALEDLLWLINTTIDHGYPIEKGTLLSIGDKAHLTPVRHGSYEMLTETAGMLSFKIIQ